MNLIHVKQYKVIIHVNSVWVADHAQTTHVGAECRLQL